MLMMLAVVQVIRAEVGRGVQGMLMMLAVVQVIRAEVGLRGAGDVDDACRCASDTGRGGFEGCRGC